MIDNKRNKHFDEIEKDRGRRRISWMEFIERSLKLILSRFVEKVYLDHLDWEFLEYKLSTSSSFKTINATSNSQHHPQTIVYNPSLNSIIYLNVQQNFLVLNADQYSTIFHRTSSITHPHDSLEIISCHDKFIFLTSTYIHVRQLYQGSYFLDSIVASINDENCHVLIELT